MSDQKSSYRSISVESHEYSSCFIRQMQRDQAPIARKCAPSSTVSLDGLYVVKAYHIASNTNALIFGSTAVSFRDAVTIARVSPLVTGAGISIRLLRSAGRR